MDRIFRKAFGKKICLIREELGMSRAEFAKSLNVTPEVIQNIEGGRSVATIEIIEKIKSIHGVSDKFIENGYSDIFT